VAIRETDKLSGAFATTAEVWAAVDRMETWSRLAWEHLEAGAGSPSAALAGHPGAMARGI
jgi:hypothetical protein